MTVDLATISIILSGILAIIAAINAAKSSNKKEGVNEGVLLNDMDYLKRGIDEVRFEQRGITNKIEKLNETVIKHDSEIKQLRAEQKLLRNKEC